MFPHTSSVPQRPAVLLARSGDDTAAVAQQQGHVQNLDMRGVCYNAKTNLWQAGIAAYGRLVSLGAYDTDEAAARVYDRAALRFRGPKASLNFPRTDYLLPDGSLALDLQVEALLLEAFLGRGASVDLGDQASSPQQRQAVAEAVRQCLARIRQADEAEVQEAAHALGSGFPRLMDLINEAAGLLSAAAQLSQPLPTSGEMSAGVTISGGPGGRSATVGMDDSRRGGGSDDAGGSGSGGESGSRDSQDSGGGRDRGPSPGGSCERSGPGGEGREVGAGADVEDDEARMPSSSLQGAPAAGPGGSASIGGGGGHSSRGTMVGPKRQADAVQQYQQPQQLAGRRQVLVAPQEDQLGVERSQEEPGSSRQDVGIQPMAAAATAGHDGGGGGSHTAAKAAAAMLTAARPPGFEASLPPIPPIATPPFLPPNFMQNLCSMLVDNIKQAEAAGAAAASVERGAPGVDGTAAAAKPPPPVVQAVGYLHWCGLPLGLLLQGAAHLAAFKIVPAEDYQALNMMAWPELSETQPGSNLVGGGGGSVAAARVDADSEQRPGQQRGLSVQIVPQAVAGAANTAAGAGVGTSLKRKSSGASGDPSAVSGKLGSAPPGGVAAVADSGDDSPASKRTARERLTSPRGSVSFGMAPVPAGGRGTAKQSAGAAAAADAVLDPSTAITMAAAAAAASAAGGVPVGLPIVPHEQAAAAAAVAAAAAAAMAPVPGAGAVPVLPPRPAPLPQHYQQSSGAVGRAPQHIGLGRRLFNAIASQLPPGAELDSLLPPRHGFVGVLYCPAPGSTDVGAALWDGGTVRDLAVFSSERDARQNISTCVRLLSGALGPPPVLAAVQTAGAAAAPASAPPSAAPPGAMTWHGAAEGSGGGGSTAAGGGQPAPLQPAGSVTEMSGGGGSIVAAVAAAAARNVLLAHAGSVRGPVSNNSASLFRSSGGGAGTGGGTGTGGGPASSGSGGATGANGSPMTAAVPSRQQASARPAGLPSRLSSAPSASTSSPGATIAGGAGVMLPSYAVLRSLAAAAASTSGAAGAVGIAPARDASLAAVLGHQASWSQPHVAAPAAARAGGAVSAAGPASGSVSSGGGGYRRDAGQAGRAAGRGRGGQAATAAVPELEAVGSSLPPKTSVIGPYRIGKPDVQSNGDVDVMCQLLVPQEDRLTPDDINSVIAQALTPAALQALLDAAGSPEFLPSATRRQDSKEATAPAGPPSATPVMPGSAPPPPVPPSAAAPVPAGGPAGGAAGTAAWAAHQALLHGPPPMPFAIPSASLLSGFDRSSPLNEAPSVRAPLRTQPQLPPAASRPLAGAKRTSAGGAAGTAGRGNNGGGVPPHVDGGELRSAAAAAAAGSPGDRPAEAPGDWAERPRKQAREAVERVPSRGAAAFAAEVAGVREQEHGHERTAPQQGPSPEADAGRPGQGHGGKGAALGGGGPQGTTCAAGEIADGGGEAGRRAAAEEQLQRSQGAGGTPAAVVAAGRCGTGIGSSLDEADPAAMERGAAAQDRDDHISGSGRRGTGDEEPGGASGQGTPATEPTGRHSDHGDSAAAATTAAAVPDGPAGGAAGSGGPGEAVGRTPSGTAMAAAQQETPQQ